jgi:gamma-F420-2:alpha-L-glutamate ligase
MRVLVITLSGPHSHLAGRFREEFAARGADPFFCHPDKFAIVVDGENQFLTYDGKLFLRPDFVLTRTGTGEHAPNVIRAMEAAKFDVANRIDPILDAIDKGRAMVALKAADPTLPVPKSWIISSHDNIPQRLEFPAVLKRPTGSCGRGVMIVDTLSQLRAALDLIDTGDLKRRPVILQEYLGDRPGVDLRVIVVGGRALGAMQRVAKNGERRANMAQGAEGIPIELTPDMANISERASQALQLDFCGVDLLYKNDRFCIAELNSSPGLKFETVTKINIVGSIADFVVARFNAKHSLRSKCALKYKATEPANGH